jgi:hypothetical protein
LYGGDVGLALLVDQPHELPGWGIRVLVIGSCSVSLPLPRPGDRAAPGRRPRAFAEGLGLAIARRVTGAHQWRFDLRPGPEGGVEVEILGGALEA